MSLSMHDRRVLADIQQHVMEEDPDLALLLTSFGRSAPRHRRVVDALRRRRGRLVAHAALVACVVLLVAAVAIQNAALLVLTAGMVLMAGLLRFAVWLKAAHSHRRGRSPR
jgi:Flp pilus assembly protein TadB